MLNSHTHSDHVGDNWEFFMVYGMDTDFTRSECAGFTRRRRGGNRSLSDLRYGCRRDLNRKLTRRIRGGSAAYIHDGEKFDLGGRTIEVIATPGHTPDSISLLDRANGLLFTGDTFYPAPIWLLGSETDLDAYAASIRRLAALAPQDQARPGARTIFPSRRPPCFQGLVAAFDAVLAGKVPAERGPARKR